ncbi:MAG: SDR family NAD(P)-dependent oxidoreductase [Arenicellales bacterium]
MLLDNKTAVVTGGNGGIGVHLVSRLISAGVRVSVADRVKTGLHADAEYIEADLAVPASVRALTEKLRPWPPDILINLAGLNAFGGFESMSLDSLETLMQVNLLAPMQLVHAVLPAMIARGGGQIVNMGSVVGHIGLPYFAAYAASKAGIENFSESLRRELHGRGVGVTYVAPRAVHTPMNQGAIEDFNRASGAREDPPDRVAEIIVEAIARSRPRVTIGYPERLFVKINALFPSVVDRSLIRNRRLAENVLAAHSS